MTDKNTDFWDNWNRLSATEHVGRARRDVTDRRATQKGFDRVLAEYIDFRSKDHDFYSYTFPALERLLCWPALSRRGDGLLETLYGEIGFLRPGDKAMLINAGDNGEFSIEVEIRSTLLKEKVLAYYREHDFWPSSASDVMHDMELLQKFMDYCAECVIDNILHNSLEDF